MVEWRKQKRLTQRSDKTSSTPYDDAFRTMLEKSGRLRIPFINEMFHLTLPLDATITSAANEFFIGKENQRQRKIITDSTLHIDGRTFHIECQSTDDGTILVRMLEYDMAIALREHELQENHLTIKVPYSGVLFLRKTPKTPDRLTITIRTRDENVTYPVDVIHLADYTLDDLIQKKLLFLFPFFAFNLEREFSRYERNNPEAYEKVMTSFNELLEHMNSLLDRREITYEQYLLITNVLQKVTDALTRKYTHVRKDLDEIMGGRVLEFPWEKLYKEAEAKGKMDGEISGRAKGKVEELLSLVHDGILDFDTAIERAKRYGVNKTDFQDMLDHYDSKEDLLQG